MMAATRAMSTRRFILSASKGAEWSNSAVLRGTHRIPYGRAGSIEMHTSRTTIEQKINSCSETQKIWPKKPIPPRITRGGFWELLEPREAYGVVELNSGPSPTHDAPGRLSCGTH